MVTTCWRTQRVGGLGNRPWPQIQGTCLVVGIGFVVVGTDDDDGDMDAVEGCFRRQTSCHPRLRYPSTQSQSIRPRQVLLPTVKSMMLSERKESVVRKRQTCG